MIDLLEEFFKVASDEHRRFERVVNPRSRRPDLHAFLLLDELVPGAGPRDNMIGAAEHDEIWLGIDCVALAKVVTREHIVELVRCGVRYDESLDALAMFV